MMKRIKTSFWDCLGGCLWKGIEGCVNYTVNLFGRPFECFHLICTQTFSLSLSHPTLQCVAGRKV
jgi:hypothetical protein